MAAPTRAPLPASEDALLASEVLTGPDRPVGGIEVKWKSYSRKSSDDFREKPAV